MREQILITGFGPFGDHLRNVSGEAAEAVSGHDLDAEGFALESRVLPVQFERACELLSEVVESGTPPAAALALGIHSEPGGPFRLELLAKNERHYSIPDLDGQLVTDASVEEEGPAQKVSTLPVAAIKLALDREGFDVELSEDAGRYLCNAVFYWLAQRLPAAGFLHVPPDADPQQVQRAIRIAAEATATRLLAQRVEVA